MFVLIPRKNIKHYILHVQSARGGAVSGSQPGGGPACELSGSRDIFLANM